MQLLDRIRKRLGDLWWYTILLFVVQRMGDVINMFVGLWLVPKYVSQSELGAVLPLSQFVSLIGLPMGLVAVPFMKFLNVYTERGELGKAKSLLRDVFACTGIMSILTFLTAYFLLPLFFERMRVVTGSLGMLVVGVGILTSIAVIFQNAVQGLKLYSTTVLFNTLAAPFRLALMLVFMPFRPLSGYFVGQSASPGVSIIGALWVLRKRFGKCVKAVPYLREDWRKILKYALPVVIITAVGVISTSIDQLIIRHRLSDFDSAGYYMISRFSDIASYFGSAFVVFLFPMVASKPEKGEDSLKVLRHSIVGTIFGGLLVAFMLWLFGGDLLGLQSQWKPYCSFSNSMALLAVVNVSTCISMCFSTYETAQGRFRFLWYVVPLTMLKSLGLYAITGISFFEGILPSAWIRAIEMINPCRLNFLLFAFLITNLIVIALFVIDVFGKKADK